ncbi:MAG: UDP-N-acetylmuramoyl-tripeptide--D-alanyl-D-alanine ligase [Candidatus Hydrogenedentes bacterium]|nr:UDP-N-acetylmuramoyl-tripeptide--D-alanyl-D-alanine ligase [Candidatus Hydrogenedentota bacterium]
MGWSYTLRQLASILDVNWDGADCSFSAVSTDTRTLQPGELFFALSGERFDGNQFVPDAFARGASAAVCTSASGAGPCLVVRDALGALQSLAAYHRSRYAIPVLALTGSCGKTSTKDFAAAVLATKYTVVKTQGNLNNEIGCPRSLLQIDAETRVAVVEMGANHRGEIAQLCRVAKPTESAITLIAPSHLEGFGSIDGVAQAKAEIVEALPPNGTFYINNDDPWCVRIGERFAGDTITFGRTGDVALEDCRFDESGEMRLRIKPIGELRLPLYCRAHAHNVLLAVAVGLRHGVSEFEAPLRAAIQSGSRFKVYSLGPLSVIDDTYNANPRSMEAALQGLADRPSAGSRIAALGEMLELGADAALYHRGVGEYAGKVGVTHLFARGPHACDTIGAARSAKVPFAEAIEDHHAIAEAIHRVARPGDVLLVKGSRGMKMERVLESLRAMYS